MTQRTASAPRPEVAAAVDFYKKAEAAAILRVGLNTLNKAIASGQIKTKRIGGRDRIPASELQK